MLLLIIIPQNLATNNRKILNSPRVEHKLFHNIQIQNSINSARTTNAKIAALALAN